MIFTEANSACTHTKQLELYVFFIFFFVCSSYSSPSTPGSNTVSVDYSPSAPGNTISVD